MRSLSAIYWAQAERTHCKGVQLRMQHVWPLNHLNPTHLFQRQVCCVSGPKQVDRQFIHTAVCVQRSLRYLAMCEWLRSCHSPQEITKVLYFKWQFIVSLAPLPPWSNLFREPRSPKGSFTPCHGGSVMPTRRLGVKSTAMRGAWTASPPFWDASWTEQLFYMKAPFIAYYETHCLLAKVWPGQLSSNACWW